MASLHMSEEAFVRFGTPDLAYVRPVKAKDIPGIDAAIMKRLDLDEESILYAVHSADGEQLTVMTDKESAFDQAAENDLYAVWVH